MPKIQTIQAKVTIGFLLGPLILAVFGAIVYSNTAALIDSLNKRQHSYQVLQQSANVTKLLVDAETGQRGYLITEDDKFLAPYEAATLALQDKRNAVEKLMASKTEKVQLKDAPPAPNTSGIVHHPKHPQNA